MYATKRRRRSGKPTKDKTKDASKSNPSKRHRERLNSELEQLSALLPFDQNVVSKLDKLSVLRLAVSFLRVKSYFAAVLSNRPQANSTQLYRRLHQRIHSDSRLLNYPDITFSDTDSALEALGGFLLVITSDCEVFYASHTVEQYLGFHHSDIIHQSVLELIHSEDREMFKTQLNWWSQLTGDAADFTLEHALKLENSQLLLRNFTARFRCLLDNASGFITLEVSGKIRSLPGQNSSDPRRQLALFALCRPFGPLPLVGTELQEFVFKTMHSMDLAPTAIDERGKQLFNYSDSELAEKKGYDLIHPEDLNYYAAAHQELINTGSVGLIAYRLLTRDLSWLWLQSSARVVYKNTKPESIVITHRRLTDDDGRELLRKRGSEFKLPFPIVDTQCGTVADRNACREINRKIDTKSVAKSNIANTKLQQHSPDVATAAAAGSDNRRKRKSAAKAAAARLPVSPLAACKNEVSPTYVSANAGGTSCGELYGAGCQSVFDAYRGANQFAYDHRQLQAWYQQNVGAATSGAGIPFYCDSAPRLAKYDYDGPLAAEPPCVAAFSACMSTVTETSNYVGDWIDRRGESAWLNSQHHPTAELRDGLRYADTADKSARLYDGSSWPCVGIAYGTGSPPHSAHSVSDGTLPDYGRPHQMLAGNYVSGRSRSVETRVLSHMDPCGRTAPPGSDASPPAMQLYPTTSSGGVEGQAAQADIGVDQQLRTMTNNPVPVSSSSASAAVSGIATSVIRIPDSMSRHKISTELATPNTNSIAVPVVKSTGSWLQSVGPAACSASYYPTTASLLLGDEPDYGGLGGSYGGYFDDRSALGAYFAGRPIIGNTPTIACYERW